MPIFMDLHKLPPGPFPTREDLYQIHARDLAIQDKYGITYMVYIVNMDARSVFCILHAPDMTSCEELHKEAHSVGACHIIEVKGGEFVSFITEKQPVNELDMLELVEGVLDDGYRSILTMEYLAPPGQEQEFPDMYRRLLAEDPRATRLDRHHSEFISFYKPDHAVAFAIRLREAFLKQNNGANHELRIGIATGLPVSEGQQKIFGAAIDLASFLCGMGKNGSIMASSLTGRLLQQQPGYKENAKAVRVLDTDEEEFLTALMQAMNELEEPAPVNMEILSDRLHISQSGMYRKMKTVTGDSMLNYLRDIRLRKAFHRVSQRDGNIAQIAYDSGFTSPSYFTRSFKKRFGLQPSELYRLTRAGMAGPGK